MGWDDWRAIGETVMEPISSEKSEPIEISLSCLAEIYWFRPVSAYMLSNMCQYEKCIILFPEYNAGKEGGELVTDMAKLTEGYMCDCIRFSK